MPLRLSAPIEKSFVLEISDAHFGNDGEPTKITIRQATQDANERRSFIYSEVTNIISQNVLSAEMQLRQRWSLEELKRMEAFLTLVHADILDVDGTPLFRFKTEENRQVLDMNQNEFKKAWGKLDPIIAAEIHQKVMEVNVDWGGPLDR
jgi:hypothetical protein